MVTAEEHTDWCQYAHVVDQLLQVETPADLMRCLMVDVQALLPFGALAGGRGRIEGGHLVPEVLLTHAFSSDELDAAQQAGRGFDSAILGRWLETRRPLALEFNRACDAFPRAAVAQARRLDFGHVLAHGHQALGDQAITYFSFHALERPVTEAHRALLARLMPHLHRATGRIQGQRATPPEPRGPKHAPEPPAAPELTRRQQEILRWLSRGKTNWEISQIMGTSEANVKYHLSNLMRREAVHSRASLVYKLCQKGSVATA